MAAPTAAPGTLRPDLESSYEEFNLEADRRNFVGHRVLPLIRSETAAGKFGKIPVEELLKDPGSIQRAPGGSYQRNSFKWTPVTFACLEYGEEEPVDKNEARLYGRWFDAEQVATQRAMDVVLREYEKRVAAAVFNATTWAAATTGVTVEWSTPATAVPITDVATAKKAVFAQCGLWPNTLVINRVVFENLKLCAQIIDQIKYSGFQNPANAMITEAAIAQALGIDQLLIAGSAKNSAKEGQSASISSIWSNEYAMICAVPMSADFREPGIGRTIHWPEDGSMEPPRVTVESYDENSSRSTIIRARHQVDEVIIHVAAGHLLSNITA